MMGAWSVADQDMGPSTSQLVLDPRWHSLRALVIGTPELQKGGSDADGGAGGTGKGAVHGSKHAPRLASAEPQADFFIFLSTLMVNILH